jgi:flavin-dependent dehydrogenase
MRSRRVVVLGAGPSGLAAALVLAREGHRVTLIERDAMEPCPSREAVRWDRKGIPHFLQPHQFIPRGRHELRKHLPDVHECMLREGAQDLDLRAKLPGTPRPEDSDLQHVKVRRPLIEWALRDATTSTPGIEVRPGVRALGVRLGESALAGVDVEGGSQDAEVVIDAMGRTSPMQDWLAARGAVLGSREKSDCGVIYYTRYYRLRPGRSYPDGPWLIGPRGDLGYMGFMSIPGDNETFSAGLAVPTGVPELKIFRHEAAFEAAIAQIPLLRTWADPDLVEPITPVVPMGGLQNAILTLDADAPDGLFPLGDALCHTDPVLAHGLAFVLIHAAEIARALREHDSLREARAAYLERVTPWLRERYDFLTALDDQRLRMWRGEPVDFSRRDRAYALFSFLAAGTAAMADPDVFRVFVRRIGLLDSTRVLDDDPVMQERIEALFRELRAKPRPAAGPTREEMLEITNAALVS